jgi:hypothetical protein
LSSICDPCAMEYCMHAGLALLLLVTLACHAATAQLIIPSLSGTDERPLPLGVRPGRGSTPNAASKTEHESGILLPRARARPSGNTTRGCPLTAYKVLRCQWAPPSAPRAAAALEERCE